MCTDWILHSSKQLLSLCCAPNRKLCSNTLQSVYEKLIPPTFNDKHMQCLESFYSIQTLFQRIPTELVIEIFKYLHAAELFAVACSCRHWKHLSTRIVPGLSLHLHPHQRDSGAHCCQLPYTYHFMYLVDVGMMS